MVNMRAGLPRLGTVCDEYRLGDLRVCPAVVDGGHDRPALRAQLPCQALSLNNSHQQDRDIAAWRPRL
jgi:hypothetical protein